MQKAEGWEEEWSPVMALILSIITKCTQFSVLLLFKFVYSKKQW